MSSVIKGVLSKLNSTQDDPIQYELPVGSTLLPLNTKIGQKLTLIHSGHIYCTACGEKTRKSYAQGHCYICMKKLASCDMCMMKPETCHFNQGTCREPEWAQSHCMVDHYVYLSNTSGLKVGITRHSQIPVRWVDQGATQGLPVFKVKNRHISGLIEVALTQFIADKTNWRAMLKGDNPDMPLHQMAEKLKPQIKETIALIRKQYGDDAVEAVETPITSIRFPVKQHPVKIASHNFDKNPQVTGILQGIKGQYLIFDTGVINIRKFTGYEVEVHMQD